MGVRSMNSHHVDACLPKRLLPLYALDAAELLTSRRRMKDLKDQSLHVWKSQKDVRESVLLHPYKTWLYVHCSM